MINLSNDKELLDKLKSGDHDAFEKIYHLHKTKLTSNLLRLLKSPELAEELLQELFVKIWEQRQKIDSSQSINAYLYKVAQNMVYDTFRKISRDKRLHEHLINSTVESYKHIEENIFNRENQSELEHAINLLPLQQQKVFRLCKFEDKSYEEVGVILNISKGTVNNHIYRANLFLKEYFSKKYGTVVVATILLSAILFSTGRN